MLHGRSRSWFAPLWAVGCLGLVWWVGEPPAAAVGSRGGSALGGARVMLPALSIAIRPQQAVELTDYFPNPAPRVQAVGNPQQAADRRATDRRARLLHATELAPTGIGYRVTAPGMRRNFGTYELVELIQQSSAAFAQAHPDSLLHIGDLSRRRGGTIRERDGRRVHSSHRNGLDVDVGFLRERCDGHRHLNSPECPADIEENLELMKLFVQGGPETDESLVRTIYVGERFRARMCRSLRGQPAARHRYADVLQRMQVIGGHEAHFHVRLHCPKLSRNCPQRPVRPSNPCRVRP